MYLLLPGSGSKAASQLSPALDTPRGIDVSIDVEPAAWVGGGDQILISKANTSTGWSWMFILENGGDLRFVASANGSTTAATAAVTPPPLTGRVSVRAVYDRGLEGSLNVRRIRFFTATSINGPWTQVGVTTTFISSAEPVIQATPAVPVTIGDTDDNVGVPLVGRVYAAQVWSTLNSSRAQLLTNPDFTTLAPGTVTFTDSVGIDWTLLAGASIPEQPLPPADIEVGGTRMRWYGADLVTGRIIAELSEISTDSLSRRIGTYTSTVLELPIPRAGPGRAPSNWLQSTIPGRTMIVAVPAYLGRPIWAGIVMSRAGGTDATVQLACATLEAYYDRRWVRDHDWTQQDEASIIATGLAQDAENIGDVGSGIGVTIDAPPTGTLRDRAYLRQDRKTVHDALRELQGVIDGPEWTIDVDWADASRTRFAKVLRVRKRIGVPSQTPAAVFQTTTNAVFGTLGTSEARYLLTEDYSNGRGANYVIAYSSGEGEDQPESEPQYDQGLLVEGWPLWESVWQPSSSITNVATLNAHAAARLELTRLGVSSWQFSSRWTTYPMLGEHWNLGDDVRWDVVGHRHPDGTDNVARCVGWDLNPTQDQVTPILVELFDDTEG